MEEAVEEFKEAKDVSVKKSINQVTKFDSDVYNAFVFWCKTGDATKAAIIKELGQLLSKLHDAIGDMFDESQIGVMNRKAKNTNTEFAIVLYFFSSFDICCAILRWLNRYYYKYITNIMSTLYQGFATTDYMMAPGQIVYTGVHQDNCEIEEYEEGKILYQNQLIRCTKNPLVANHFARYGHFFCIELDYGMPHFHIEVGKILNPKMINSDGVYIFPWLWFKVIRKIMHDNKFFVYVKQAPFPKEAETGRMARFIRESNTDSYKKAWQTTVDWVERFATWFNDREFAYDLFQHDMDTNIPMTGWEC